MLFSYGSGQQRITTSKNVGKLLAILIAMRMGRYGAWHIAQWSMPRASLEATGCRHWTSACTVLPRWPPWSLNLLKQHKTQAKHNF